MTWVIGTNGIEEIMEAVQNHPAPIMPTSTMTSPIPTHCRWVRRSISNDDLIASIYWVIDHLAECQLLVDSVLDQSRVSNEVPALQGHHFANDEHPTRARRPRWQEEDLVITATLDGRIVQLRPLPDEDMTPMHMTMFGAWYGGVGGQQGCL